MTSGNIHTIISDLHEIVLEKWSSHTHLDHLEMGDLELASLWIEDGGHDGVQGVAVDDRTRISQLISLLGRCMHAGERKVTP